VCRRAERAVLEWAETQAISNNARQYFNRLCDVGSVMARVLNRDAGGSDPQRDRTR
jgi:cob(I)alamin adenosyltransferase